MKTPLVVLGVLLSACSAAPTPASGVTGTWRVTISAGGSTITGMASLKQNGEEVTGWVGPNEDNPIPIRGVLKAHRLSMTTSPQPGRTVAFDRCDVTVNAERMVGTIEGGDTHKGTIEFVRNTP
jgi:hypothetical protein